MTLMNNNLPKLLDPLYPCQGRGTTPKELWDGSSLANNVLTPRDRCYKKFPALYICDNKDGVSDTNIHYYNGRDPANAGQPDFVGTTKVYRMSPTFPKS